MSPFRLNHDLMSLILDHRVSHHILLLFFVKGVQLADGSVMCGPACPDLIAMLIQASVITGGPASSQSCIFDS